MTGASRQFGYVEFKTAEEAELASNERFFIDCKVVNVKMSGHKEFHEKYRIWVGGLLKETSKETLHEHFSQFGDIFECNIVYNEDNISREFGFVTYKSQDSVDSALNFRPHSIDSQVVFVKHATIRPRNLTMFIGNLSPKTTDESLRDHFSKHGQLLDCYVNTDLKTGLSRGFSHVTFFTKEDIERARAAYPHDCGMIRNSAGKTTDFVTMSNEEEIFRALADRPHYINEKLVFTHQKGKEFGVRLFDIPKSVTDEDLYETFSKNGKLVHWEVMRDRKYKTNRSLGFAYLAFSSAEDVDRLMDRQPYSIHGTMLTIQRRLWEGRKKQ
ncbi:RNA recognition motif domain-containing protein [Ditylenchus destructor]|nr:RNA recognition motif domain-containing protein [Ditylenchus destructor]